MANEWILMLQDCGLCLLDHGRLVEGGSGVIEKPANTGQYRSKVVSG